MAAAIVALVGGMRRRPWLALVTVVAWTSAFEIANSIFSVTAHRDWGTALIAFAWEAAALAGWPLLAAYLGVRPDLRWLTLSGVTFVVWAATGLDYNYFGQTKPLQIGPEIANVVAKTALGMAYLAGALRVAGSRGGGAHVREHRDHEGERQAGVGEAQPAALVRHAPPGEEQAEAGQNPEEAESHDAAGRRQAPGAALHEGER
jgi:hypothetical protein